MLEQKKIGYKGEREYNEGTNPSYITEEPTYTAKLDTELERDNHTEIDKPRDLSQAPIPKRGRMNQGLRSNLRRPIAVNKRLISRRTRI